MKKKLIVTIISAACCFAAANAQDVLPMVADARTAAMGDVGLSFSANAFSVYNYAGVIALDDSSWGAGYTFGAWMPSFNIHTLHTVSGYFKPADKHSLAAGFRYFFYPETGLMTSDGELAGQFSPFDIAVDVGYGFAVCENLAVATTVRYLGGRKSNLADAGAASAFGADLGMYYRNNNLSAAVALSNVGTKVNYGGADYDMPARVRGAAGYMFSLCDKHALNGTLEAAYVFLPENYTGFEAGIGLEYVYNGMAAFRAGYRLGNSESDPETIPDNFGSSLSYATLGAGLNLCKYSLDVSYLLAGSGSPLRNSVRLSLSAKF